MSQAKKFIEIPAENVTMGLNTPVEEIQRNIEINIRRGLPQVEPKLSHPDRYISIVGGGPSLEETFDDLKQKYDDGQKVVALNGTFNWLMERGIRPSVHIIVDARQFNARFVSDPHPKCKYLIASQCHPDVFDALKGFETYIWHPCSNKSDQAILHDYYFGRWWQIVGGSTVMLRAFTLMSFLGWPNFEAYGFDSCFMGDKHHVYEQAENNGDAIAEVAVGDKTFLCNPWMYSQAKEFIDTAKGIGQHFNLVVHGDGLIAHIIKHGATRMEESENGSSSVVVL